MESIILKFEGQSLQLFPRDEADVSVMREIFKLREYRQVENIIRQAQDPILDIGAHVGFFSLYCRMFNPQAKIFALEPEEKNLELLTRHLKINNIKGIKIIPGALAGKSGERILKISPDSHNHQLGAGAGQKVRVYSLSDFCHAQKIKKIALLKMDIEGAEFEVFKNLESDDFLLFKNVILEYHNSGERNYKELETKLRENGFGAQVFPSKFDKTMGFIFASNKRGLC